MKKKPVFIAFSTQKGGVGKTTFTVLAASYLHYVLGYHVIVVDCDYPQFSINEMRKRDAKGFGTEPILARTCDRTILTTSKARIHHSLHFA